MILFSICSIGPIFAQFTVTVNPDTLKNRCGTNNVKLVFVAKDSLWYVDFSEQNPQPGPIKNITGKPITPVFSPDGNFVAFVTGVNDVPPLGAASPNSVAWACEISGSSAPQQIANPGWSPRFDLAAFAPTVIYSTCGKNSTGLMDLWNGCGKVSKTAVGSSQASDVWTGGSLFGGMSYNGQWLCTADNRPAYLLNITNPLNKPIIVHRLHAMIGNNNDTLISVQACNPSISSSRIFFDAMMYLDVGTDVFNAKYLGDWAFHSRIFISRSTNAVARYFDVPSNPLLSTNPTGNGDVTDKEWESPRWSNHPYFASSALKLERSWGQNSTTRNESIYLINLHDSVYTKLITLADTSSGNSLSLDFPWLWVETPFNFDTVEDKNWLNGSLDRNVPVISMPKIHSAGDFSVRFARGVARSSYPLSTIELFALTGRRVGWVAASGKTSVFIPGLSLASGALFMRCTFTNNKQTVVAVGTVK
jgi:hypothetical protein